MMTMTGIDMPNPFFDHPILNSPYECPRRHWELDPQGQPTQRVLENRRRAEFITPIPKPKKRKKAAQQDEIVFDEGKGLSTKKQQYDLTSIINEVRNNVDSWRALPNPNQWQVSPETSRLLQHWRHHKFSNIRPFFCQVEAVETAIWLTEVAPHTASGKRLLEHLAAAIRVDASGRRATVPQLFLHQAQILTGLIQQCGRGVASVVQAMLRAVAVPSAPEGAAVQTLGSFRAKQVSL
jgi:hypothetical protein